MPARILNMSNDRTTRCTAFARRASENHSCYFVHCFTCCCCGDNNKQRRIDFSGFIHSRCVRENFLSIILIQILLQKQIPTARSDPKEKDSKRSGTTTNRRLRKRKRRSIAVARKQSCVIVVGETLRCLSQSICLLVFACLPSFVALIGRLKRYRIALPKG